MQEEEAAADAASSLGQSEKQSRDTSPSIGACLLLLNCKKWIVSLESPPVQMQ